LRFASRDDAKLQLDLIPSNDEIPLLKVEYGEIKEEERIKEIASGEALKEQVDGDVLEHFRSRKASEFLVAFRNKHYATYYEYVRL
jgi:hypothetical protein